MYTQYLSFSPIVTILLLLMIMYGATYARTVVSFELLPEMILSSACDSMHKGRNCKYHIPLKVIAKY